MENEITQSDDGRLGFVKELARIAYAFRHDDEVFSKKVLEFINIDSLKEKGLVSIDEYCLNEEIRIALDENKLSEGEFDLCCLLQKGFSAEEIAAILGLKSKRSVHVKQSRLKKKLKGTALPEAILVMLIQCMIFYIIGRLTGWLS